MLMFATASAWCEEIVTNVTELLPCIGFNGKAGVGFAFEATVVWTTTPSSRTFCVKAADGHIRLVDKVFWPKLQLSAGDVIMARGRTFRHAHNGYVNADCLAMEKFGHVTPDPPVDVTIADVIAGNIPSFCPVRICGTLRDAFIDEIDRRFRFAIISSGANSISLNIRSDECGPNLLAGFIGAEVRVIGCSMPFSGGTRKLLGTTINVHYESDIKIISPPPDDPFDVPPIESIHADNETSIMNLGRHLAKGAVIAVWQYGDFAVKTKSGNIVNVSLADGSPPSFGDAVEVAGLPYTDLYRINLRRAIWRRQKDVPAFGPEKAEPVDIAALFPAGNGHHEIKPKFHGKAISIRGMVTGVPSQSFGTTSVPSAGMNDGIVRLQCDGFPVTVDACATPRAIDGLEVGSEVEISGTYIAKVDSWHPNEPMPRVREVVLVVRTPSDVKVLASPPWWTPGRFLVLVAALLAVIAAFLLWNILLRRLVDRRGAELMQTRLSQEESKLKVQERTRIAVELHDTIAQNLTGVSLEIDSAEQLAAKDTGGMMKHLDMAARTLQSCRNELRNCLWDLRSRALEEEDLNEAIRRTIAPMVPDVDLSIRFNVARKDLTDDSAHVLMRIVRELVMNAVRHGGATVVRIAGCLEDDVLRFSVSDNGSGFDPKTCPGVMQGHFGLQGIRERINQFGGEMQIVSAPGKGCKVSICLKFPRP